MNASRIDVPLGSVRSLGSVVTLTFLAFNRATTLSTLIGRNPMWSMACPALGAASPFLREEPHATVIDAVDAVLGLSPLCRRTVRRTTPAPLWDSATQAHVVQAELGGILDHFDQRAPGVDDLGHLKSPGIVIAGMTTFTLSACSFFMVASRSATEKPMRLKTLPALGFGISVF